jgi:hypothetical protein
MEAPSVEWLYIAAQPHTIVYGPTKIGWSARSQPYSRIEEHGRLHTRIELVVAFGLPSPLGWALERQVHRLLRSYRIERNSETKWYHLPANECFIALCKLIAAVEPQCSEWPVRIELGPGWDRLLETVPPKAPRVADA